jgi:hypothetical protein
VAYRLGLSWVCTTYPSATSLSKALATAPEEHPGAVIKLFADESIWDSFGSGRGGCGAVVRRLLGPVR